MSQCTKQFEHLGAVGILEIANDSEWGSPQFDQIKAKKKPQIQFMHKF